MMRMRALGRSGLNVSEVSLGTMTFGQSADAAACFAMMDAAWQAGVTLFDTADVYPPPGTPGLRGRSEEIVGAWLKSRAGRQRVLVATKVGRPMGNDPEDQGLAGPRIVRACEESLRRLQTDYIDLYQTHAPDPSTPIEETLEALNGLVRDGKVRSIGCSNYSTTELAEAMSAAERHGVPGFACLQSRYNLLYRSTETSVLPFCASHGLGVLAYSPLAGGLLTDARARGPAEELRRFLATRGTRLTHAALWWVLSQPTVSSAIVGASHPSQLSDTLSGLERALDAEEATACDALWGTGG